VRFPCVHAAATTPVQRPGVLFAHLTQPCQPSPVSTSGSACTSSFSRFAQRSLALRACTLARSPYVVTAIRRLQTLRLLHVCSGRFRLEAFAGWGLHPLEKRRLVTAHRGRRAFARDLAPKGTTRRGATESSGEYARAAADLGSLHPSAAIAGSVSLSTSVLASLRSAVSKPSSNQPRIGASSATASLLPALLSPQAGRGSSRRATPRTFAFLPSRDVDGLPAWPPRPRSPSRRRRVRPRP